MQKLDMEIERNLDFSAAEAFKAIRANLMFMGSDIKTIMLTSSVMDEGKSTVSWNLALSIADSGKRTLYIDADMRKSVFMGRHNVQNKTRGLSHFLSGQAELEEVIFSTPASNLFVLPSGTFPPNPSELLSRKVFGEMMKALKNEFDYIIIDTPPLFGTIDAAIISGVCDGSIIIIGSKRITKKVVKDVIGQLQKTGTPVLGVIINKADYKNFTGNYYKYYGKYYGKYYTAEESDGRKSGTRIKRIFAVGISLFVLLSVGAAYITYNKDVNPPTISFSGNVVYAEGADQSVLLDGVKALDNKDGDVSNTVVVERIAVSPDKNSAVIYYAAKDRNNNIAKANRTVEYIANESEKEQEQQPQVTERKYNIMVINNMGVNNLATAWGRKLQREGHNVTAIGISTDEVRDKTVIYVPEAGEGTELLEFFPDAQILVGSAADRVTPMAGGAEVFVILGTNDSQLPE